MTAGSVIVPTIVPLRAPTVGKAKNVIDSNTKIEIQSATPGTDIYYTVNETKPEPFSQKIGSARDTFKYRKPITLKPGKRTIKAVAVAKDDRMSHVVTKVFHVEFAEPTEDDDEDDDLAFQRDMVDMNTKAATKKLMAKIMNKEPWQKTKDGSLIEREPGQQQEGTGRFSKERYDRRNRARSPEYGRQSALSHSERLAQEAVRLQNNATERLQQRLSGGGEVAGGQRWGHSVHRHPDTAGALRGGPSSSRRRGQLGVCPHCRSSVPFNTVKCLVCEGFLADDYQPRYAQMANDRLVCTVCGAGNPANYKSCATCESRLYVPASTSMDLYQSWQYPEGSRPATAPQPRRPATRDEAVQTVGLYFPSERDLKNKLAKEEERYLYEKNMRTSGPLMSAISPGRGYWRKQMDHICAHLRSHAQNNAEFRSLIGSPRMSKILSTTVHEDGYEMSMTVTFALKGNKDPLIGKNFNLSSTRANLSNQTMGFAGRTTEDYVSQEEYDDEEDEVIETDRSDVKKKTTKKIRRPKVDRLLPEERSLLKEVGKKGEGRSHEVQRLLDEGADANVTNKSKVPILHVATLNEHLDALPILVQGGASINAQAPPLGNTALHEAVNMGPKALAVVECLLNLGASPHQANNRGESAYDLAAKNNNDSMVSMFATKVGQSQLEKLARPKSSKVNADSF